MININRNIFTGLKVFLFNIKQVIRQQSHTALVCGRISVNKTSSTRKISNLETPLIDFSLSHAAKIVLTLESTQTPHNLRDIKIVIQVHTSAHIRKAARWQRVRRQRQSLTVIAAYLRGYCNYKLSGATNCHRR